MEDHTLGKLLDAASDGDRFALQCLIIRRHEELHRLLCRKMYKSTQCRIDPDDVLQDTYAAAFRAVPTRRFANELAFSAWLRKIAVNEWKDRIRSMRRKKRDVQGEIRLSRPVAESSLNLLERVIAPGDSPSECARRKETVALLLSSIARLTDDQRAVIRLRFISELPVHEVAARLSKSETAVHSLCYRALKTLQSTMASIGKAAVTTDHAVNNIFS